MQLWKDWLPDPRFEFLDGSLLIKLVQVVFSCFVLRWAFGAGAAYGAEVPVTFTVDLPERLQNGQILEADKKFRADDEDSQVQDEHDGRAIYPRCPTDGSRLQQGPVVPATQEDIDTAISEAASAQKAWATTSFAERRRVLNTLLQYILANQDDIVNACCLDSGKTKIDACFGEILVTAEKLQWTVKHGEKALRPSQRPTNLLLSYKRNTVHYEPLGVVAACVSWNYPFHNLISPIISALFSGNAIVAKPSEQTCWSSQYFINIIRKALVACGHSSELVQIVVCLPDMADYLTSHPSIEHVIFIGSREVAHKVALSAAKSLTSVTVELGGKDPAIVLDDSTTAANIDSIASIVMRGTFQSAGQNCIGIERVVALPGVHDKILSVVKPLIQSLRLGSVLHDSNAPDLGSMISSRSFIRLEALIKDAVRDGAILHCGGGRFTHPTYPNGHYFQPTLLSDVTMDMEIAQTELFAPVFLLMRASNVDEAISIANSTSYALGACVFGHYRPDVQKCVQSIRAGMVAVNDFATYYACSLPFGGRDGSGYGRFGGEEGLRGLCNIKSVCEETWWARLLGIRTSIPKPLRYPVQGSVGWRVCKGIVETGYSTGWYGRMEGVLDLLGALMDKDGEDKRRK